MPRNKDIKKCLESMMFVWGSPLKPQLAADALGISTSEIRDCMDELINDYDARESGLMIREINGMFQFCTRPECEPAIARLCTPVRRKNLSNAAMEALAIVAYNQPVTRSQIDYVRGVKSERVVEGLLKQGFIEEKGRGSGLGRPVLFGTTDFFLEKFGLSSLDELPGIESPVLSGEDGAFGLSDESCDYCSDEEIQQMSLDISGKTDDADI